MDNCQDNLENILKDLVIKKLGKDVDYLTRMNSSRDNLVYLDKKQKYIIKVSLGKPLEDIREEIRLLAYLSDNKFPCPKVVYQFEILFEERVFPVVVTEYIKHKPIVRVMDISSSQIKLAAETLCRLHSLTRSYCKIYSYSQVRTFDEDIVALKTGIEEKKYTAANSHDIHKSLSWALEFFDSQNATGAEYVLHNDYRFGNVLFTEDGQLASVIDFDWAIRSSFIVKDIAHSALEWSFEDGQSLSLLNYKLFIDTYMKNALGSFTASYKTIREWVMFSAIADAAHYFLCNPDRLDKKFESYMYDKYEYFRDHEI